MGQKHECPYRRGLGWMIHEVASVVGNWDYAKKHGYLTEEVLERGLKRLKEAEDFGRAHHKEPSDG